MFRSLLAGVVVACLACAYAQPTTCTEDSQCALGLYCDNHMCQDCLSCTDLKREPPQVATGCIRSIIECGPCLNGLVYDLRGDGGAGCVPPDARDAETGASNEVPNYVWFIIAVVVLLVLVGGMVYCICRRTDSLKFNSSINAVVHVPEDGNHHIPTAPEHVHLPPTMAVNGPPPDYSTVHPTIPASKGMNPFDEEWPFLPQRHEPMQPRGLRESADNQRARVFNNPNYVPRDHVEDYPPSPGEAYPVITDPEIDDDTTRESFWRPHLPNNNVNNVVVPVEHETMNEEQTDGATGPLRPRSPLPAELAQIRKKQRSDDNNNTNGASGSSGDGETSPRPASGGRYPFVHLDVTVCPINIIQNATTNKTTIS